MLTYKPNVIKIILVFLVLLLRIFEFVHAGEFVAILLELFMLKSKVIDRL